MPKPKDPLGARAVMEARKLKRHIFYVKFGVYIALVIGVVGSQALVMADDLTTALKPVELGQVLGSVIVAGALYNKLEDSKGSVVGKTSQVPRLLRNAVYHGFFWMTIMGSWW